MSALYFNDTPPKSWDLFEALKCYDKAYDLTIESLCVIMKKDIDSYISSRQNLSNKSIDCAKIISQKLSELMSLKCLKRVIDATNSDSNPKVQVIHGSANLNVANVEKQKNVFNNQANNLVKRRRVGDEEKEEEEGDVESNQNESRNVYTSSPSLRHASQYNLKNLPSFDEYRCASHLPTQLTLTHGKKQYIINTPSHSNISPHKPKLTKSHIESLQEYVQFAQSNLITVDEPTKQYYKDEKEGQKQKKALEKLGLLHEVDDVLEEMEFDDFPRKLWSKEMSSKAEGATSFSQLIKYVLTNFHLLCRDHESVTTNHERSFFVNYVVPGLLALSKACDTVSFTWCEFELEAIKSVHMFDQDLKLLKTPRRFMDALGKLKTPNNMEIVIVESSSGGLSEDVTHSIEDTLKTIECATAALVSAATKYKNASVKTFRKLKVYSIHVIKNTMTLTETTLHDQHTWKRVELRSCNIPTTWTYRYYMLEYLELLAKLNDGLYEVKRVEEQLMKEHIRPRYVGSSLAEYLDIQNATEAVNQ
ncbi:hypothetical protein INT45_002835 [Circinella minor]|uniref:Uncharacterized protein n=1 Tax=Circinella minor TaxID=1195481 RepID=A0A8H7VK66_9FUNG|nr:hypothetical protein INT45_002835 [Circinella minor]